MGQEENKKGNNKQNKKQAKSDKASKPITKKSQTVKEEQNIGQKEKPKWYKRLWVKVVAFLSLAALFIGLFVDISSIVSLSKSDHDRYIEDNFIQGILLPNELLYKNDRLVVDVENGKFDVSIDALKQGQDMREVFLFTCEETGEFPMNIKLKIENNRLFVSTVLRDIQKEEVVGNMEYNRWSLFKPNLLFYYPSPDHKSLEVIDRGGNVIFYLSFEAPNILKLKGYFIGDKTTAILSEKGITFCLDKNNPNYKKWAMERIRQIQPKHRL